jgi:type III pantothenate kinase
MGMVKELIKHITNDEFSKIRPIIVATGGFSNLYKEDNLFDIVVPELVLEGIHIAIKINSK